MQQEPMRRSLGVAVQTYFRLNMQAMAWMRVLTPSFAFAFPI